MKLTIFFSLICFSLFGQSTKLITPNGKVYGHMTSNTASSSGLVKITYSGVDYKIPIDTSKIKASTFDEKYLSYEPKAYAVHEELEYQYFLNLTTTESYLVCEKLLDIYEKFSGKELNGELLYNHLKERNFLLAWYGLVEDVEDTKTKVFKLSKDQLREILNLK